MVPGDWEVSSIVNTYKGKGDSSERLGCPRELVYANDPVMIVESMIELIAESMKEQIEKFKTWKEGMRRR